MLSRLVFVDCEAPYGCGAPSVGDMTEIGAVHFQTRDTFYGPNCSAETFQGFRDWLLAHTPHPVMVSDNPAYDFQWVNFYFWRYQGSNPFGHSARRIGDFYAGLVGNFETASAWKRLRVTKHTHHPVDDAMGNVEAFARLLKGERP